MGELKYKESAIGCFYHIFNRGNQKQKVFRDNDDYRRFLFVLSKACEKHDFEMIGYCLMPNHYHLLFKQNGDAGPSKLMSSAVTSYAMVFNKKHKTVGHVFQNRFKQKVIMDDQYLMRLLAYIHMNPVKSGICNLPDEYEYSSYKEYCGEKHYNYCDHSLMKSMGFTGKQFEFYIKLANSVEEYDAFD